MHLAFSLKKKTEPAFVSTIRLARVIKRLKSSSVIIVVTSILTHYWMSSLLIS